MKPYKVTLIGDPLVGKTMISNALVNKPFNDNYKATVGASMVKIQYNDKETGEPTWFYLWDTAGQEKYKSLAPVYFQDSDSVIIVYDVADEKSFQNVLSWHKLYKDNVSKFEDRKILIVGNKIDLRDNGQMEDDQSTIFVDTNRGENLASKLECDHIEVSAKTGKNIELIIEKMVEYSKLIHVSREESIITNADTKSSCC